MEMKKSALFFVLLFCLLSIPIFAQENSIDPSNTAPVGKKLLFKKLGVTPGSLLKKLATQSGNLKNTTLQEKKQLLNQQTTNTQEKKAPTSTPTKKILPTITRKPTPTIPREKSATTNANLKNNQDVETEIESFAQRFMQEVASRSARLQEMLAKFSDREKARRVEKLNDRLAETNAKITTDVQLHLEDYGKILTKLETRIDQVTDKDTSAVKTAIEQTKAAITEANNAAIEQAQKDYTLEITSETMARSDVENTTQKLKADTDQDIEKERAARKLLTNAITVAIITLGEQNGK